MDYRKMAKEIIDSLPDYMMDDVLDFIKRVAACDDIEQALREHQEYQMKKNNKN